MMIYRLFPFLCLWVLFSCQPQEQLPKEVKQPRLIESDTTFSIITNGLTLGMQVFYPNATGATPVVMVLHGCGGLYSYAETKEMESHFLQWIEWGRKNKVIMVFPDSFNPRGFSEFCNMAPPEDAICSPAYERPRDVYTIMEWMYNQSYIDTTKIGLLGFSHGGSTTIASVVDYNHVKKDQWTISVSGSSYTVPKPVNFGRFKFAAAVAYYPGCGFYGYFGSTVNPNEGKYLNNAPLLILAAGQDPLYTSGSTEVLYEKSKANGAGSLTNNQIELVVYEGANHSFDGKTVGADSLANTLAMQSTTKWFKDKLKL